MVAALCGRALDQRQRLALSESNSAWEDGRASLMLPRTEQESKEHAVRARVEHLSASSGRPLLSSERWQASEPVLVDGVDVSDMFAQPFVLRRSLTNGFRTENVSLQVTWQRPEAFLDLVLGQTANGSVMLRFTKDNIRSFLRSHSGLLVPVDTVGSEVVQGCERYDIAVLMNDVTVSCAERKLLGVAYPAVAEGKVLVTSNLSAQEVGILLVKGIVGELKTEDNA